MKIQIIFVTMLILSMLGMPACGTDTTETSSESFGTEIWEQDDPQKKALTETPAETEERTPEEPKMYMQMRIGDMPVNVKWEDNASVEALKALCADEPLVVEMSMYGGFEQVGSIGTTLPRNDVQITTEAGDIVLYAGNQIVVFYGSNSWAYTRLGHITDQDAAEMAELLGNANVTIMISME